MSNAATPEPMPIPNESRPIYELLIDFICQRAEYGKKNYKTYLQAHNGRDALMDALQESVDLNQYLMQMVVEGDARLRSRAVYAETLAKDAKFDADRLRKMELEARSQRDSALALAKEAVEVLEKITTNAEDILKARVHDGIYDRVHFLLTGEIDLRAKSARAFLAHPEVKALKGGE